MKFRCPTTASSSERLLVEWVARPSPVPLAGFFNLSAVFANSNSTALFHAVTVPGLPPTELSPHEDRVAPLGTNLLPCCHLPVCGYASLATLSPPISPTPALLAQLPGSLNDYELPFHQPEGRLPGHSGSPAAGSSPTTSFTSFEVLSPP